MSLYSGEKEVLDCQWVARYSDHMRVAIYTRISTLDQSLELQRRALLPYAEQRGLEVFRVYEEIGISGSKARRPQLDQLMDDAHKRKFDIVLVWRFDRFARSTLHLAQALEVFRVLGIQFISYSENIDTSTPIGQAMFSIIGAMAQLERDIIIERVNAGIAVAQAAGVHCGRPGIKMDEEKVREAKRAGKSNRAIATELGYRRASVNRFVAKLGI